MGKKSAAVVDETVVNDNKSDTPVVSADQSDTPDVSADPSAVNKSTNKTSKRKVQKKYTPRVLLTRIARRFEGKVVIAQSTKTVGSRDTAITQAKIAKKNKELVAFVKAELQARVEQKMNPREAKVGMKKGIARALLLRKKNRDDFEDVLQYIALNEKTPVRNKEDLRAVDGRVFSMEGVYSEFYKKYSANVLIAKAAELLHVCEPRGISLTFRELMVIAKYYIRPNSMKIFVILEKLQKKQEAAAVAKREKRAEAKRIKQAQPKEDAEIPDSQEDSETTELRLKMEAIADQLAQIKAKKREAKKAKNAAAVDSGAQGVGDKTGSVIDVDQVAPGNQAGSASPQTSVVDLTAGDQTGFVFDDRTAWQGDNTGKTIIPRDLYEHMLGMIYRLYDENKPPTPDAQIVHEMLQNPLFCKLVDWCGIQEQDYFDFTWYLNTIDTRDIDSDMDLMDFEQEAPICMVYRMITHTHFYEMKKVDLERMQEVIKTYKTLGEDALHWGLRLCDRLMSMVTSALKQMQPSESIGKEATATPDKKSNRKRVRSQSSEGVRSQSSDQPAPVDAVQKDPPAPVAAVQKDPPAPVAVVQQDPSAPVHTVQQDPPAPVDVPFVHYRAVVTKKSGVDPNDCFITQTEWDAFWNSPTQLVNGKVFNGLRFLLGQPNVYPLALQLKELKIDSTCTLQSFLGKHDNLHGLMRKFTLPPAIKMDVVPVAELAALQTLANANANPAPASAS